MVPDDTQFKMLLALSMLRACPDLVKYFETTYMCHEDMLDNCFALITNVLFRRRKQH